MNVSIKLRKDVEVKTCRAGSGDIVNHVRERAGYQIFKPLR